jgi:hypothetical protein
LRCPRSPCFTPRLHNYLQPPFSPLTQEERDPATDFDVLKLDYLGIEVIEIYDTDVEIIELDQYTIQRD